MYGPTGAGKTYTMLGNDQTREGLRQAESGSEEGNKGRSGNENDGVLLQALDYALECVGQSREDEVKENVFVKCSYLEIYNDNLYDLLQEKGRFDTPLTVNETGSKKFVVKGAIELSVTNTSELMRVIRRGERKSVLTF